MMTEFRRFVRRAVATFRISKAEADLAREIRAHLQLLEDRYVESGMTREDARYAAQRAFGGVEQAKELQRDARGLRWLAGWPMDLKLGARMMMRSPGLTVVAVIALAVAIGAGAAYLEFTRDLMYPTLPVANAEGIVGIQVLDPQRGRPQTQVLSDFAVWRADVNTFDSIGAARPIVRNVVTDDGRFARARSVEISASAFRVVPVSPLLGRTLTDEDERPSASPVVVIGADLWHSLFDGDANVIGRTLRLGSTIHTVVGVLPQEYAFPENQNLWSPLTVQAAGLKRGEGPRIQIFGRLKEGVSATVAQARLQGMLSTDTDDAAAPSAGAALRADVRPYIDSVLLEDRNSAEVIVFHGLNLVFLMFLAICGANVATLVFARTTTREVEITVRSALGASRGRISAQLFAEALVLSGTAVVVGLAVAQFVGMWVTQEVVERAGKPLPFWWDDRLSPQTILYAFALAFLAALIVGVVPALKATGAQLQGRLRQAGGAASTMGFGRVWTGVMITQVAITVVFLTTTTSFSWIKFRASRDYDVTFARERFVAARPAPLGDGSADAPIPLASYRSLADKLITHPGIANVTYASELPGAIESAWCALEFAAPEVIAVGVDGSGSRCQGVGPNYFETMGIPLVAGRLFTEGEVESNRPVAIVDETFVRLMLGGQSAIGLMLRDPKGADAGAAGPWYEIVGVVKDVKVIRRKSWADAMVYRPVSIDALDRAQVLMRTHGAAAPVVPTLQAAQSANDDVRLTDLRSLDQAAASGGFAIRILLRIAMVSGAIALLLSTAGIYALISFTLTRRTREIGIRAALGAEPQRIVSSVLGRALAQIGAGILAGAVPSAVIMIFGIDGSGGMPIIAGVIATFVVCTFVIVVAALSCAAPLRRALRIDPTEALRLDA